VFGLQRGFAAAGARTVVAGLWQVDDDATKALMIEFYRNLWDKKLTRLAALRQAQLTILNRYDANLKQLRDPTPAQGSPDVRAAPYFWAAFVLAGDWR
jgi:CHAT domain-containing protein